MPRYYDGVGICAPPAWFRVDFHTLRPKSSGRSKVPQCSWWPDLAGSSLSIQMTLPRAGAVSACALALTNKVNCYLGNTNSDRAVRLGRQECLTGTPRNLSPNPDARSYEISAVSIPAFRFPILSRGAGSQMVSVNPVVVRSTAGVVSGRRAAPNLKKPHWTMHEWRFPLAISWPPMALSRSFSIDFPTPTLLLAGF
ncbi:hypothetical protein N656DRAFT_321906 [Canariomyces notabilis]|uniref:Uncharacterized protein n=1 Tax=Canariomyces notabilis TaxID=2074819 RepID=A0AAN6TAA3_9PEZI|nr:hypothetical protein N656DRAFT_321906 [Canariomyces arenarius]